MRIGSRLHSLGAKFLSRRKSKTPQQIAKFNRNAPLRTTAEYSATVTDMEVLSTSRVRRLFSAAFSWESRSACTFEIGASNRYGYQVSLSRCARFRPRGTRHAPGLDEAQSG